MKNEKIIKAKLIIFMVDSLGYTEDELMDSTATQLWEMLSDTQKLNCLFYSK